MAKSDRDRYGIDPYGILGRGDPGGTGRMGPGIMGSGVSVGRVGIPQSGPGFQTTGTGLGGSFTVPIGGRDNTTIGAMAKGGKAKVKKMAKGGSASKRADGCATKGKTKGRMV